MVGGRPEHPRRPPLGPAMTAAADSVTRWITDHALAFPPDPLGPTVADLDLLGPLGPSATDAAVVGLGSILGAGRPRARPRHPHRPPRPHHPPRVPGRGHRGHRRHRRRPRPLRHHRPRRPARPALSQPVVPAGARSPRRRGLASDLQPGPPRRPRPGRARPRGPAAGRLATRDRTSPRGEEPGLARGDRSSRGALGRQRTHRRRGPPNRVPVRPTPAPPQRRRIPTAPPSAPDTSRSP